MGLVSNVFDDRKLAALDGDLAIGHTRYSTTGSSMWKNSQPVFRDVVHTQFALGHNGNLVNTSDLVEEVGILPGTVTSDTDAMAEWVAQACRSDRPGPARRPRAGTAGGVASLRGCVLPRPDGPPQRDRCPRSAGVPSALPRQARLRMGSRLRVAGARHRRCALRPRARPGRDGHHRRRRCPLPPTVPGSGGRPEALPVRVRLLRPPRRGAVRPERPPGPCADGRATRRPGSGRR